MCVYFNPLPYVPSQSEPEISALVHFASRERGEFVIGGNDSGMLFWYIQSTRQKGFNLLLTERRHYSRVTGLEVSNEAAQLQLFNPFLQLPQSRLVHQHAMA